MTAIPGWSKERAPDRPFFCSRLQERHSRDARRGWRQFICGTIHGYQYVERISLCDLCGPASAQGFNDNDVLIMKVKPKPPPDDPEQSARFVEAGENCGSAS